MSGPDSPPHLRQLGTVLAVGASTMVLASLLVAYSLVRARGESVAVSSDFALIWATRATVVLAAALRWFDFRVLAALSGGAFLALAGVRVWMIWAAGLRPTTDPAAAVLYVLVAYYAAHAAVAAVGLFGRGHGWRILWIYLALAWLALDGLVFG